MVVYVAYAAVVSGWALGSWEEREELTFTFDLELDVEVFMDEFLWGCLSWDVEASRGGAYECCEKDRFGEHCVGLKDCIIIYYIVFDVCVQIIIWTQSVKLLSR